MVAEWVRIIERLNFAQNQQLLGAGFPAVVALLSIVFGGSFLLYAWKHHKYYLGITGLLVGAWLGLILKKQIAFGGSVPLFMYVGLCGVAGAFVAVHFRQLIGVLLGGFTVALLGAVLLPSVFFPRDHALATVSAAFLMGGGLGAMFPKFFFVLNASLIGSVFVTYGVSAMIAPALAGGSPPLRVLIHLLVFLPLLVFGLIYQLVTTQEREPVPVLLASAPPPTVVPQARAAR